MKKLILIIVLLFVLPISSAVTGFEDVPSDAWYYEIISTMVENDIISGYGDGTFRPDDTISVEEFVTITIKTLGETPTDTGTDHWSDGFIDRASTLNWIQPNEYEDYTREITRAEMSRIVLRASGYEAPEDYLIYAPMLKDIDDMSSYWQNIILRTYALGIISGYPDGKYRPDGFATRAEASAILIKLLQPSRLTPPSETVTAFDLRRNTILKLWQQYQPRYTGELYVSEPHLVAPYQAGELESLYLDDAINMLRFMRGLAGLSQNVYYTQEANLLAQHGALLNAVSEFSHTPTQPDDMSDLIYNRGYDATSSGNLAGGIASLPTAIIKLVDDETLNNLPVLGHRRWFLWPYLYEVGLGYLETTTNYRYYSVIKVFNGLQTQQSDYETILWPNETAFPVEFFNTMIPWSLTLNPAYYDYEDVDEIAVTLRNDTQGTQYFFDERDKDLEGTFFNVETTGYGVPFCIIFRPDYENMSEYQSGDHMTIIVEGIKDLYGDTVTLTFETTFFSLLQ